MKRKFVLVLLIALLLAVFAIARAQSSIGNAYGGPGLLDTTLYAGQTIDAGTVHFWNSPQKVMVQIEYLGRVEDCSHANLRRLS